MNWVEKETKSVNWLSARIRELEAKLRELAEAAEWRDECREAEDFCHTQLKLYYLRLASWRWRVRWDRSYQHSGKLLVRAESDYQAALDAAKGE